MIPMFIDYASPSALESNRDRALLGLTANARRPVRFHGRLRRNVPLFRFALRALGEAVWSQDVWSTEGELKSWVLDPVVTVHPDRLFFEAFSQDQSVYVALIANPDMFELEGEMRPGTTNIDFTAWLWGALNELRSSRETWLRVEAAGFEVRTHKAGGRFEQKVNLPDSWVRGFLQVTAAMARPGTRLTARPVDLLSAIRFLRYTKAKLSPRALRYEFDPGQDARLVLEPWEQTFRLRGAEHNYTEHRVIRTWGRRRLSLIEPLLPFAHGVDIYLKGRALPSFYAVKLPDLTFVLGLSGWSEQAWSGSGNFQLLETSAPLDTALLARVQGELATKFAVEPGALAQAWNQPRAVLWQLCEELSRQGRAVFDVERREFRHRELFDTPIDVATLFPPDERLERAQALTTQQTVHVASAEPQETRKIKKLKTPGGKMTREIVYRDWRVKGTAGDQRHVEIVLDDVGRIIFGTCGCAFFQEHLLGKGPCEHMLALFHASAAQRLDLPTSRAADPAGAPPRLPSPAEDDEEDDEHDDEQPDEKKAKIDEDEESREDEKN
jgi:hypothetical protein